MNTKALARRQGRGLYPKRDSLQRSPGHKGRTLPEYLESSDVEALIRAAPHSQAAMVMLLQWRAGLRVSEALALEVADLFLDGDRPTLKVRQGKGGKDRVVPVHPELGTALRNVITYGGIRQGRIVTASRSTAWRWIKQALTRAQDSGAIPLGKPVGTHTLRHSAARHWLAHGIPINTVSRWLGHANLKTTLVYLEILPDPLGDIARVP